MSGEGQDDLRMELARLARAAHQRLEMERSFGVSHVRVSRTQSIREKKAAGGEGPQKPIPQATAPPAIAPKKEAAREEPPPAAPAQAGSKAEDLERLRKECEQCTRCELARTRTKMVFGTGSPDADLMFVGEAPGEDEDKQGEPFVGKAGQLLTKMIEAMDMKRSEVYICNVLKSRPPSNRPPMPHEMASCLPFLKRQIRIVKPKIICTLGATATRALLGINQPMGQVRGRFFEYEGVKLLPTFHPSYLLRSPWEKGKAWEDLKKVRDTLKTMRERGE